MIKPETKGEVEYLKDYGFSYTIVSLFDDIRYNTRVNIDGRTLTLICGYNNRTKTRWISIETSSGSVLLRRTPLVLGRQCELDSVALNFDMDYLVGISPKDKNKVFPEDHDYLNWSKDFNLVFTGMPYTGTKKMKRDLLDALVGE